VHVAAIHDLFPWLRHLFADSAYAPRYPINSPQDPEF
jgi:hypothetical protein